MRNRKRAQLTLLTQQSGHIQLLIVAPILTLSFLSLVVRTASSAVDSSIEKKKVTEQLKRRLSEAQNERSIVLEEQQSTVRDGAILVAKVSLEKNPSLSHAQNSRDAFLKQQDKTLLSQQLSLPLQVSLKVKKNMTLSSILADEGVVGDENSLWTAEIKAHRILKNLKVGRTVALSFVPTQEKSERELRLISYELDKTSRLIFEKKESRKIISRKETLPVTLVWKAIGGRISSSLYESAVQAGMPKRLFDDLIDMDWNINFTSGLRKGDTFKIIFEEFQIEGEPIDIGKIVAAEIKNNGKVHTLFTDVAEKSEKKNGTFLRYPLKFTKITSVFTDARLHPILERVRPHTGVDFAAPRGTPVRAIAEGKIVFSGRQSGYGNIVKIDHPGRYDSAYAHLDRIAKNMRKGASVKKGDIIGYVGSTGLATGPHLHFEMYKDGAFVNPLTAKVAIENSASQKEDPIFAAKRKHALEQLSSMKIGKQPIVLSFAMSDKFSPRNIASKGQDERLVLATTSRSPSLSDVSSTSDSPTKKKSSVSKTRSVKKKSSVSKTRSAKKKSFVSKSSSRSKRASSRTSSSSLKKSRSSKTYRSARR